MICRIWHGWTAHEDADAFENVLKSDVFPPMHAKAVPGFHGVQMLRMARLGQTEFVNMAWFDDMDAVRQLAGENYEEPMLTAKARSLLRRSDRKSEHYEVREDSHSPINPVRNSLSRIDHAARPSQLRDNHQT